MIFRLKDRHINLIVGRRKAAKHSDSACAGSRTPGDAEGNATLQTAGEPFHLHYSIKKVQIKDMYRRGDAYTFRKNSPKPAESGTAGDGAEIVRERRCRRRSKIEFW